ncbi:MFS transporter [Eubacteriales bacterium OttesenSCG-928-M02]|nr:MFS transporter [Eubacteriales bacterium OttesenSCG-928-M02]
MDEQKMPLFRKIAYGVGDVCMGGTFNIINLFYGIFLTDMIGLPPLYVMPILLIARVYDAITDPVMGYLSDRTKTRIGRRRPYLLWGVPMVFIAMVLVFYPFQMGSVGAKFFVALGCYIFFYSVTTFVGVPYYALSGELASNYQDRSSLLSFRLLFSLISSGVCTILPGMILKNYTYTVVVDGLEKSLYHPEAYRILGLFFGGVFAIALLICGLFTRENLETAPVKTPFSLKYLFSPVKIKSFRQYIWLQLLKCVCMAFMSTIVPYYVKYYMGRPDDLYLLMASLFCAQLVAIPVYLWLNRRMSKARVFMLSSVLWIGMGFVMLLLTPQSPSIFLYGCAFLMGAGMCGVVLMPNSMFGDVADVAELYFGTRNEGVLGGFENITYKTASALANAAIMLGLSLSGYVDNLMVQNEATLWTIRLSLCLSPLFFLSIGILVARRYRLDGAMQARLSAFLSARKTDPNHVDRAEEAALMEELT